ncbi:hypothetical protein RFI_10713 [Reticulomyxa filosa]|uniref:Mnd1 HTH domain-containing protein n=1 Tax=Reticulomyxa filosa TaxID=46433 RepID=X6NKD6_RETFI|nr:hypothetical protein RFI_10713 [Reticulomyxa filosa]|eukprot:ETO26426.1 hypothetical protein RFI_10713 [Reticulomyxa filosa]
MAKRMTREEKMEKALKALYDSTLESVKTIKFSTFVGLFNFECFWLVVLQPITARSAIQDTITWLIEENKAHEEKIGTSNYLWAFQSEAFVQVPFLFHPIKYLFLIGCQLPSVKRNCKKNIANKQHWKIGKRNTKHGIKDSSDGQKY